jgi:2-oxoglutarate dehydrogenase E2 component (dihydrolipoamide succinyltransferase)
MLIEVKVPSPGESITQVLLSRWLVDDESIVEKDTEVAEIDSDKATLSIVAEQSGKIKFKVIEGETIAVASVVALIDTDFLAEKSIKSKEIAPVEVILTNSNKGNNVVSNHPTGLSATPLALSIMTQEHISLDEVGAFVNTRKITKANVFSFVNNKPPVDELSVSNNREIHRQKMTPLRQKLSQRLVSVKNETAMLTTFNEIDMLNLIELKNKFSDDFKLKFGVSLGYMSFFTKAASIALQQFSQVNSQINGDEIISFDYADIAIAVSAPKGLLVPVIRNVEAMSVALIEISIKAYAARARENKLTLDEMQGGTFTITNGGVFGSLMSTPIINPPQSAILGMHNIVDRPIALNNQVVIHPMMYVALSYDHRIIDGRESVGFLKTIKELIENPYQILPSGKSLFDELF